MCMYMDTHYEGLQFQATTGGGGGRDRQIEPVRNLSPFLPFLMQYGDIPGNKGRLLLVKDVLTS